MPPPAQQQLRFHVLSDELGDADKRLLEGIAAGRENTEVCFYEPARLLSKETLAIIERGAKSVTKYGTAENYYRLLAADLLPQDVPRALYLDGDIVCTGSLEPLFALDLKGRPAAMCPDPPQHSQMSAYNRLGYPPAEGYYNSGVILLDLCLWRKENLSKPMIGWLAANAQKRICHDQDVINACLHGRVAHLDYSCNVMTTCFNVFHWIKEEGNGYLARQTQYLPKSEWPALRAAVEKPRLVHFYGPLKPWHRDCEHPFAPVWRCFCAASPWAKEPLRWRNPQAHAAKARIKRLGRKLFEALHFVEKRKPAGIPYPEEAYEAAQGVLDALREEDGGN